MYTQRGGRAEDHQPDDDHPRAEGLADRLQPRRAPLLAPQVPEVARLPPRDGAQHEPPHKPPVLRPPDVPVLRPVPPCPPQAWLAFARGHPKARCSVAQEMLKPPPLQDQALATTFILHANPPSPWLCYSCGAAFPSRRGLASHATRAHERRSDTSDGMFGTAGLHRMSTRFSHSYAAERAPLTRQYCACGGCCPIRSPSTYLPYSNLSANSVKLFLPFHACKNSPKQPQILFQKGVESGE